MSAPDDLEIDWKVTSDGNIIVDFNEETFVCENNAKSLHKKIAELVAMSCLKDKLNGS